MLYVYFPCINIQEAWKEENKTSCFTCERILILNKCLYTPYSAAFVRMRAY
jgi:hypothetical protein